MAPTEAPADEAQADPATLGRLLQQKESEVSEMREQRVRALEAALQVRRPASRATRRFEDALHAGGGRPVAQWPSHWDAP
jgi:hypothetical protein